MNNILNYIDQLKNEPFEGWSEEAKQGYLTACISIEEKIKGIKPNVNQVANNQSNPIPDTYPDNLEECMLIFEKIKYKSFGFPFVFVDYNYDFKYWSAVFRNPANFDNPNIQAKSPLKACHEMFDFLKTLKNETP